MKVIDGERYYPIYSVNATWIQDGEHDPKYPGCHKGLPEGRIHNSTSFANRMFKKKQKISDLKTEYLEALHKSIEEKEYQNVSDIKLSIKFLGWETWCRTWFYHYTFDAGQTDAEVLESFQKFVFRKQIENERLRREKGRVDQFGRAEGEYCLMGAEDRWRWCGTTDGSPDYGNRTDPPCRCSHCKEQGVVRIGH